MLVISFLRTYKCILNATETLKTIKKTYTRSSYKALIVKIIAPSIRCIHIQLHIGTTIFPEQRNYSVSPT
ncbi:MAG: hypothetical protein NE328_14790 [Lentisphaeraceae bacterium]|nr:hypothetical protein [Lentisphaeraceae bacterium]